VIRWLDDKAPALLILLVAAAVVLRALLVAFSPTPFGYVWDFYYEGVRQLARSGHLPAAADCWQCYHPPVFYLLGWPVYAFGRWIGADAGGSDASGLRWLAGWGTVCGAVTIYYGYRLLRLFRCRGAALVTGVALLFSFPCLFISSYGAEADIVLTALLSAFLFYLTRDWATRTSTSSAFRLGLLAGVAAATKYSGLVALGSGVLTYGLRAVEGRHRAAALRQAAVLTVTCCVVAGWKYADNYRRFGTPLYANGSAAQGFSIRGRADFRRQYEYTTLHLRELMRLVSIRGPRTTLTDLPVYRSVPTTLHALAWSDMTFFSDPARHGDPSHPYPWKRIPVLLTRAVLILGLVPEALACVGLLVTIRRRTFQPLLTMGVASAGAYVWWFTSQQQWGLKTKYLLFLLPAFALYSVVGLGWLRRHAPPAATAAGALLAALILLAHFYLLAFATQ
jgi:hypothetical protein